MLKAKLSVSGRSLASFTWILRSPCCDWQMKQPRRKTSHWKYPHQKIDPLLLLDHFLMGVLPKGCHGGPPAWRVSCVLLTLDNYLRCLFLCKYLWPRVRESRLCSTACRCNSCLNWCRHEFAFVLMLLLPLPGSPSPACLLDSLCSCWWFGLKPVFKRRLLVYTA